MNAVEIEEAVSDLAATPFDREEFPYAFLAAFGSKGFGTLWNREQNRLGCNGMPFHGLRKNATIALQEAGCTTEEVKFITGHLTDAMVKLYAKKINQKRLAKRAMKKLAQGKIDRDDENEH